MNMSKLEREMPDNSERKNYSSASIVPVFFLLGFFEYILRGSYWLYLENTGISRTQISFLPQSFLSV